MNTQSIVPLFYKILQGRLIIFEKLHLNPTGIPIYTLRNTRKNRYFKKKEENMNQPATKIKQRLAFVQMVTALVRIDVVVVVVFFSERRPADSTKTNFYPRTKLNQKTKKL